MYGYRDIDGECVPCMTYGEAVEAAIIYADVSGLKQKIYGEHIQHFHGKNIARQHQYCWQVVPLGEQIGNQGAKGNARSNGRAIPVS